MNVTKIILYLEAKADCEYPKMYHRKLHGAILNRIPDEIIEASKQREGSSSLGISFTELMPWGDLTEGDERKLVINTVDPEIVGHIAQTVSENPTLNIGNMQFNVRGIDKSTIDVGQVGSRGTIESDTGVLIPIKANRVSEFGLDNPGDEVYYWSEDDPHEAFATRLKEDLSAKWHGLTDKPDQDGPDGINGPIFDQKTLDRTYSVPIRVTADHTQRVVLSKWTFEYEVRSEAHRNALNLALGAGIGTRNNFSLGTVSLISKTEPVLTGM